MGQYFYEELSICRETEMAIHDYLKMALRVLIRPNTAFEIIQDSHPRYYPASICVMVTAVTMTVLSDVPDLLWGGGSLWLIPVSAAFGLGGMLMLAAVTFYLGRRLGGSDNWLQVFSVVFYAHVVAICMAAAFMVESSLNFSDLVVYSAIQLAFMIWMMIVITKAIKAVNGFSTGKAFGVGVAAVAITVGFFYLVVGAIFFDMSPSVKDAMRFGL